ncbi:MAG: HRDC domain-containing protein, partial [Victivallaceae bacterium]|nr:HRDC domain-containing protein [Victivallaceae bacterium]
KMFDYACDDVKYLTELMNFITDKAVKQNTDSWLKEELKIYDSASLYKEISPQEYFRKIKGIDQLKGTKLAVLRELAAWREKTARRKDRPRGHIVHNNILISLAYKCPHRLGDLKKIERLSPKNINVYGEDLIKCIEKGMNTPSELQPGPMSKLSQKKAARMIFEVIQQKALSFNIDPAVVCSRKELNILLESRGDADYKKSRIFKAWRNEFMQQVYENIETAALLLG